MIRPDKITAALFGGVGFRDSTLSEIPSVSTENKASASGMYFQDANALVTLKNIYDTQEDRSISDDNFNTLLGNLQKSAILDTVNKVVEREADFIQAVNLYPYEKTFDNTITPSDKAVGFEIEPSLCNGYICQIPWVELAFDKAVTFNLYLYNSNDPIAPIKTQEVTTVAGKSVVQTLDWYIADDDSHKGGNFYLVYFEDELGGAKAFKKDHDLANYYLHTKYFDVEPVALDHSGTTLDIASSDETSETYGLNLGLNVYNDYTEIVIRNKMLFYEAVKQQMALRVLNMMVASTRTNDTERINESRLALYGSQEHGITGAYSLANLSINNLKKMLFYRPVISRGTLR